MNDDWVPMPRYSLRKNLVKKILKNKSLQNKTCLEFGYGSGDILIELSEMGLKAFGYDFSMEAYKNAKNRIRKYSETVQKNIYLLTNEQNIMAQKYDFIVALEVLEHIKNDLELLSKFNSNLNDNGMIIFSVPANKSKWGDNDIWQGITGDMKKKK